eukprot:2807892-Pleurochrysis_carterae.AAC.3
MKADTRGCATWIIEAKSCDHLSSHAGAFGAEFAPTSASARSPVCEPTFNERILLFDIHKDDV